jgi:hypothetical protein
MDSVSAANPPKRKASALSYLVWWKPNQEEIQKQVTGYDTLRVWQSARGISLLLCLFSVAVTILLGSFLHLSSGTIIGEALLWSTMGLFMYRGHRWAFIAAMVLWTFEKGSLAIQQGAAGQTPVVQLIWWFIYMSPFYLGYSVERRRRAPAVSGAS